MSTNRGWALLRALIEVAVVAVFLAVVVRPVTAQQTTNASVQDTTPLTLLLVIFPDTTAAQNAMTNLTTGPAPTSAAQPDTSAGQPNTVGNPVKVGWTEPYYATVSKDKNGKVTVQHHGKKGTTARDIRAENSIDGVVALLGERPNKSNKKGEPVSGAGATRAGISSANMSEMQKMLTPGKTALILVVPHPAIPEVTSQMNQAGSTKVYDAPLVLVPAQ